MIRVELLLLVLLELSFLGSLEGVEDALALLWCREAVKLETDQVLGQFDVLHVCLALLAIN